MSVAGIRLLQRYGLKHAFTALTGLTWGVASVTPNTSNFLDSSWRFGSQFTVGATALTVTSLRVWPENRAGIWRVRIHRNSDSVLMATADITVAEDAGLAWHEHELASSVELAASTAYTVSVRTVTLQGNLTRKHYRNPTAITYGAAITVGASVYVGLTGGGDDRPTIVDTDVYWVPDFGWGGSAPGGPSNAYAAGAFALGAVLIANQERDATYWYDESGNGFNGTLANAPTWTASGGPGTAIPGFFSFNGTSQRSDHGDNAAFEFVRAHTMVWWEKTDSTQPTDFANVLSKGDRSYMVRTRTSTPDLRGLIVRNDALTYEATVDTTLAAPAVWHMYAARHSGTRISIYRVTNAGADELVGADTATDLGHTASAFCIAAQDNTGTIRRWWKGDIAGVLAFNKGLTTNELVGLYADAGVA